HGATLVDAEGRVLRPCMLWDDGRSVPQCAQLEAAVPGLRAITGNAAMPGFTAPKLLWVRQHEPALFARIRYVLLPKAWLRWQLCGEAIDEMSDASGTLWLDVAHRRWSAPLLAACGLDVSQMPRLVEGTMPAGELRSPWVERWGFDHPPVIAGGAGDNAAGAVALGAVNAGDAFISLGTSGVLWVTTGHHAPAPERGVHAFCHAVPQAWHVMGVMLSAAGSLQWLRETVGGTYDELIGGAAEWEPGVEGLLFAPYLAGERTPHADPGARGAFAGLGLRHDRGALARAVLEGVAFALRDALDLVAMLSHPPRRPRVGRISGGGARSQLWLEIVASVLEMPLEATVVDEGAAYGAALLGGVAAGVWDDARAAVSTCVKVTRTIEPRPEWIEPYAEARERFRGLYPALRPLQI
ncbi:MAG: xylulokinase, partial [Solirubrobacteraceae bacterium]